MDKSEKIAKHIWHDILQNSKKPFKWGFEFRTVKTIDNGTAFRVNTKFMTGWVEIQQKNDDDVYDVRIKPDFLEGGLRYEGITSDKLVLQIDRVISEGILSDNTDSHDLKVAV